MKRIPLTGFLVLHGNAENGADCVAIRTGGLQWKYIYSVVENDGDKFVAKGRFLFFHVSESFRVCEIQSTSFKKHGKWITLELVLAGSRKITLFFTNRDDSLVFLITQLTANPKLALTRTASTTQQSYVSTTRSIFV